VRGSGDPFLSGESPFLSGESGLVWHAPAVSYDSVDGDKVTERRTGHKEKGGYLFYVLVV
jgi:hypothetical protein